MTNSFVVNDKFTLIELKETLKGKLKPNEIVDLPDILEKNKLITKTEDFDEQTLEYYYIKSPDFDIIIDDRPIDLSGGQREILKKLFGNAKTVKQSVQDANKKPKKQNLKIKNNLYPQFISLWKAINKDTFYTIDNLDNSQRTELIGKIKKHIEALDIPAIYNRVVTQSLDIKDSEVLLGNKEVSNQRKREIQIDYIAFIKDLAIRTKMPISFIIDIFNSLSDDFRKTILTNNPSSAIEEMEKIVVDHLVECIKEEIVYQVKDPQTEQYSKI